MTDHDSGSYDRLVEEETLIFAVTEAISQVLDDEQVSRSALARNLGKTKGHVTQLLSGKRNMTLRTAADLAFALNHRFAVDLIPCVAEQSDSDSDPSMPQHARIWETTARRGGAAGTGPPARRFPRRGARQHRLNLRPTRTGSSEGTSSTGRPSSQPEVDASEVSAVAA